MGQKPKFICIAVATLMLLCACTSGHKSNSLSAPSAGQVEVLVTPGTGQVLPRNTLQFQASVSHAASPFVAWSVLEPEGGTITSAGLYFAPDRGGPFHVIATSFSDTRASGQAAVTVLPPSGIAVALDIHDIQLGTLQQQVFQARLSRDDDQLGLTWTVLESGGGRVDAHGLYTAPASPGTYHLRSTSKADTAQWDEAVIHVLAANTPATDLVFQATAEDSSLWRLIPITTYTDYFGQTSVAAPGEVFLEIHAPRGITGRGYALNLELDGALGFSLGRSSYIQSLPLYGVHWASIYTPIVDGVISLGVFVQGSDKIMARGPGTSGIVSVDESPIGDLLGVMAFKLADGTPLMVGQTLKLRISKAGVLTKDGVVTSSSALQTACVRGIVR